MATIRKLRDKWQAQVRLKGIKPITKSFVKKSDAVDWSRVIESQVTLGTYVDPRASERITLDSLIGLHLERKAAAGGVNRAEQSRLKRLRSVLGAFSLSQLSVAVLSEFRDQRLLSANPTTVVHELSLLTRLLRLASSDFGIPLPQGVPKIRLPRMPRGRTRRLSFDEECRLLDAAKTDPELSAFILLAIECATRRSELIGMKVEDIDLVSRTVLLPVTKVGIPRVIPLTKKAFETLSAQVEVGGRVFNVSATAMSQRFSLACKKAGIVDLRIHDLRHEGISRFCELGLSALEVAAISGHKTISMLQRYTHIRSGHLVARLCELESKDPCKLSRAE